MTDRIYLPNGQVKAIGSGWPTGWLGGWSGGDILSLQRAAQYGQDDTLTDPFAQHVWVYACIKARARALSSTPLKIWAREGDQSDVPEVTSGDLIERLKRPHPWIGAAKLWALTSIFWDLYGECYWLLYDRETTREGDRMRPFEAGRLDGIRTPAEILPVPGSTISINYNEQTKLPEEFVYSSGAGTEVFPTGSVVPFIDVGTQSPLRGLGATEALRRRLLADFAAETLDIRAAENGGIPGFWLATDEVFAEPQLDQMEARLEARHNSPSRHLKPALLHGGFKIQDVAWTPRDMENLEMRTWSRDAILAAFGVTKPILGITDDVNRANAREAKAVFWEETIIPQQSVFETTLRDSMLSRLIEGGGEYVGTFDRTGVEALSESMDEKLERVEKLVALGVTFNKAAELADWEIDPLADEDLGVAEIEGQAAGANAGEDEEAARPELTLNGAQIASLLSIIEQVADGSISKETGVKVIVAAFPFDEARARDLLADIEEGSREPEPEPAPFGAEGELGSASPQEPNEPQDRAVRAPRTAQAREAYARAFEDSLAPHEQRLAAAILPIHTEYLQAVKTKLRQVGQRSFRPKRPEVVARAVEDELPPEVLAELQRALLPTLETWVEKVEGATKPILAAVYFDAVAAMALELGVDRLVPETDVNALAFLATKSIKLAEGTTSTLAKETRNALARIMLEEGDFSVGQISDRILETFEDLEAEVDRLIGQLPVRADRIARTESAAVSNRARTAEMVVAGVREHVWVSSRDAAVRHTHAELDGKRVGIGEEFRSGLRWPLDDRASASEVINCRCTTAPIDDEIEGLLEDDEL